jgi:TolA-binding protein
MRSAYRGHQWEEALAAADAVKGDKAATSDLLREADYVKAKASLARSDRDKAFSLFENLSRYPATDEGAEACFQLIQRSYDTGDFADVEKRVYQLAQDAPGQNYWLAKAFIVLGDSFAEQGNLAQAKATFESIRSGYTSTGPQDDVLDQVDLRLRKLQ